MMKLVERYIYDVVRKLPEDMKDDVKKELLGQIEDMLGDTPSEDDIKRVLTQLGDPRMLANNYRGQERYLISPAYFDSYMHVLKIVLIIMGILGFIGGAIDGVIDASSNFWLVIMFESLSGGVSSAISAMLTGFAIVTLIFVVLDYKKVNLEKDAWTLAKLPELPKATDVSISRTKTTIGLIVETIFASSFVLLLYRYQDVFGWYENDILVVRYLNTEIVSLFLPFLAGSIILNIILHGIMIYKGFWNNHLAWSYTTYQVLSAILGVLFIAHPNLLHAEFIMRASLEMGVTTDVITHGIQVAQRVISAIIIIIASLDILSVWYKVFKSSKIQKEALN